MIAGFILFTFVVMAAFYIAREEKEITNVENITIFVALIKLSHLCSPAA
jgi:hypothetical protein